MILITSKSRLTKLLRTIEKAQSLGFTEVFIYEDGYSEPKGENYAFDIKVDPEKNVEKVLSNGPLNKEGQDKIRDALARKLEIAKEKGYSYVGITSDLKTIHAHGKIKYADKQPVHTINVTDNQETIERNIGQITTGDLLVPDTESAEGM